MWVQFMHLHVDCPRMASRSSSPAHWDRPVGGLVATALSIYSATGASGFSLGLVAGGLLTELGWRWTFLLPVPIAIALLVAGSRLIPRDAGVGLVRRTIDLPGALTLTGGMLLLGRTVVDAPQRGWGDPLTVAAFAGAGALLIAFVAIERSSRTPLVRLRILRSGPLPPSGRRGSGRSWTASAPSA